MSCDDFWIGNEWGTDNSLSLFEQMDKDGVRPNDITFIAVLTACSSSGMASGLFDEAKEIILRMPTSCRSSDEAMTWRALLNSCCSQKPVSQRLLLIDSRIRKDMKERGVEKTPGCSTIEVNGFIHEFVAGETTHPQMEEIHKVLEKMNHQLE
ncbi:hypothetical protein MKW92_038455 [Papaver armeniacum]|nr:hypothetical protein MKW92_038455 [Papaver armeniacum]